MQLVRYQEACLAHKTCAIKLSLKSSYLEGTEEENYVEPVNPA